MPQTQINQIVLRIPLFESIAESYASDTRVTPDDAFDGFESIAESYASDTERRSDQGEAQFESIAESYASDTEQSN